MSTSSLRRLVSLAIPTGHRTFATKVLYCGNLSWKATDNDLRQAFAKFGNVEEARVITDRMTGRSRGFGFVDMEAADADKAAAALSGSEFMGRELVCNESSASAPSGDRPYTPRREGGSGGYGGNGGYQGGRFNNNTNNEQSSGSGQF